MQVHTALVIKGEKGCRILLDILVLNNVCNLYHIIMLK